jgi:hypothetical protein
MSNYPTLPNLKDHQQTNIPLLLTISKRVGQYPETDFKTKQPTGRMQTLYNFTLPDGKEVRHYSKEREEEILSLFSAGEQVQVVRQEATNAQGQRYTFNVWTPKEGAEARLAANPPLQKNTQQTASQHEMKEREEKQEQKSIEICLQGFAQTFIIQGKTIDEALSLAVEARKKLIAKSGEVRLGITMPVQSTSIDTVNEAFGIEAPLPNSPADYL